MLYLLLLIVDLGKNRVVVEVVENECEVEGP